MKYCLLSKAITVALFTAVSAKRRVRVRRTSRLLEDTGTLVVAGDNGIPFGIFPLSRCQGDCDRDLACKDNLVCFQTIPNSDNSTVAVPGCVGETYGANDFCIDPADVVEEVLYPEPDDDDDYVDPSMTIVEPLAERDGLPALKVVGDENEPISAYPLGVCEGDCDSDRDCAGTLICFKRDRADTSVPGCTGTVEGSHDYCISPDGVDSPTAAPTPEVTAAPTSLTLALVGEDKEPEEAYPLGLCEGDCDGDNHCAGYLVCYQRPESQLSVPGCVGEVEGDTDYCIDPASTFAPTLAPTAVPTYTATMSPTAAPTPEKTEAPTTLTLALVGEDKEPEEAYPLGLCEGDCDGDLQCAGDLVCYQRSDSDQFVPGCVGEVEGSTDYCIELENMYAPTAPPTVAPTPVVTAAPTSLTLALVGEDKEPEEAYPLGLCEGDCDGDNHCAGNLVCYQRPESKLSVPGCVGEVEGSTDYCVDPASTFAPTLAPTAVPTYTATMSPTEAPTPEKTGVPTSLTLILVGEDKEPEEAYPLGLCEGDCDGDLQCAGDLVCYQRSDSDQFVPGCVGEVEGSTDYCIDPMSTYAPSTAPTAAPTKFATASPMPVVDEHEDENEEEKNEDEDEPKIESSTVLGRVGNNKLPADVYPLGLCQGDCDGDGECAGNLVCFRRSSAVPFVPGCTGEIVGGTDYCIDPDMVWEESNTGSIVELDRVGNDNLPEDAFPLGLCQGDCDGDSECAGSLVCFRRSSSLTFVPGCIGEPTGGTDYCIDPGTVQASKELLYPDPATAD